MVDFDTPEMEIAVEAAAQTFLKIIREALTLIPAEKTAGIKAAYEAYAALGGYNEAVYEDYEKIFADYIEPLVTATSADELESGGW